MAVGKLVPKDVRILRAAEEVFSRKGYDQTTLDEIVRIADTGKGTVYKYFKNKEMLFYTLVRQKNDELMVELNAVYADHKSFQERMLGYARTLVSFFYRNQVLWAVLIFEILTVSSGWQLRWNNETRTYDVISRWGKPPTEQEKAVKIQFAELVGEEITVLKNILVDAENENYIKKQMDPSIMAQNMYFSLMTTVMQGAVTPKNMDEAMAKFLDSFLYGHLIRQS